MYVKFTEEYTFLYNQHACYHMNFSGICKKSGKKCDQFFFTKNNRFNLDDECPDYINHLKAIPKHRITPKLRKLIEEATPGQMFFVEKDDDRFTLEDLTKMIDNIVLTEPNLSSYVDIDLSKDRDYLIIIYQGLWSVLVD